MNTPPPVEIPLFPLAGVILLPGEALPLNVFEPRYLNMIDDAMGGERAIGVVQTRAGGTPDKPALEVVGGLGRITAHTETPDGRYLITLEGAARFRIAAEIEAAKPYRIARADYAPFAIDRMPPDVLLGADRDRFLALLKAWFAAERIQTDWETIEAAPLARIVDRIAMAAPFTPGEKQALLEARDGAVRFAAMSAVLARRLAAGAGGAAN